MNGTTLTERDSAAAARAFQARLRWAWDIARPKNPKAVERLSIKMAPEMRRRGLPFHELSDSTIRDNVFGTAKCTVSKWEFVHALLAVLIQVMIDREADPAVLGTAAEWYEEHEAARKGVIVQAKVGAMPGLGLASPDNAHFGRLEGPGAWWSPFEAVVPHWDRRYLDLEPQANRLMFYEPCSVPELLQTPDYARAALTDLLPGAPRHTIDALVDLRMRRQELTVERAAIWVLLERRALLREVGSSQVMRDQYRRLADAYDCMTVNVQVVSTPSADTSAAWDPYVILRFPRPGVPDVAYLPNLAGPPEQHDAKYLDDPDVLSKFIARYSTVGSRLSRQASAELIMDLLRN